jgi:hypothetical protein
VALVAALTPYISFYFGVGQCFVSRLEFCGFCLGLLIYCLLRDLIHDL